MIKTTKPRAIAYIRVSTDNQDVDKQRFEILDYAHKRRMRIDEFISIEISSRKTAKKRRIDELMYKLKEGDTLIISELSRLGRSTPEILSLVNALVERKVRLIAIKQQIDLRGSQDITSKVMITVFSLMAELERDLISSRTKEALAVIRRSGVKLGRPAGKIGASKLDGHEEEIKRLLAASVSKAAIARTLKTARFNLYYFMKSRGIESPTSAKRPPPTPTDEPTEATPVRPRTLVTSRKKKGITARKIKRSARK